MHLRRRPGRTADGTRPRPDLTRRCRSTRGAIESALDLATTVAGTLILVALLSSPGTLLAQVADAGTRLDRIAVGSCIRQDRPQPIWDAVLRYDPQVFLLIGDNVYGDTEDMDVLRAKYELLASDPGFSAVRDRCAMLATWDDHDYGVNDGGEEYPQKVQSQQVFNDFWQTPADSPRRARPGIYDAATFGPPGQRVRVILLDTRYFRTPLRLGTGARPKGIGPYVPDDSPGASMLGEAQWEWLVEQLRQPAELTILASSIQFVSDRHGWEAWANFPRERQRLLRTIAQAEARRVVLVSGDRHLAEISRLPAAEAGLGNDLYDLTASSLNQAGGGEVDEPNPYRVGGNYREVNFGTIDIDWSGPIPRVTLGIRDVEGKVVGRTTIEFTD